MKTIIQLFSIALLASCVSMEPAAYYYQNPHTNQIDNVGEITYVIEKNGYSIIMAEAITQPLYIKGKLTEIEEPYENGSIWKERRGDEYAYHFVYDGKRYLIDHTKSNILVINN